MYPLLPTEKQSPASAILVHLLLHVLLWDGRENSFPLYD